MKLFTSLPARKDGTLIVRIKGATYIFEGKPLACEVENEAHAEHLRAGNFQTEEEFDAEQKFQRLAAEREARRAAWTARLHLRAAPSRPAWARTTTTSWTAAPACPRNPTLRPPAACARHRVLPT